jgi:hypothetical protein
MLNLDLALCIVCVAMVAFVAMVIGVIGILIAKDSNGIINLMKVILSILRG